MAQINIRTVLRELRGQAWEAELGETLRPIGDLFDAWRRGEASAFDLTDAIHRFHQGASREIWKKHQSRDTEMLLAEALEDGHLRREQMPEAVYALLLPHVERLRTLRAQWKMLDEDPPAEDDAD
jgi:hypothetical protein